MTELGIIGAASPIVVEDSGRLRRFDDEVAISWWVGADDRWHDPVVDAAVRQGLTDGGTAVETRMRVPGGDLVHRVVAVPSGGRALARVEITNETPVPVAVAVVVDGATTADVYEDLLRVDGNPLLRCSRTFSRIAVAESVAALADVVAGGGAVPIAEWVDGVPAGAVAAIVPLPHTATVTFVASTHATGSTALPSPLDVPAMADVDRGWDAHLEQGLRLSVPDDRSLAVVDAALRHLLAASAQDPRGAFWRPAPEWSTPAAAVALASWGHGSAASELLLQSTAAADPTVVADGSLLWAWSHLVHTHEDPELLAAVRPWAVDAVARLVSNLPGGLMRRRPAAPWTAVGLAAAAPLLALLGEETMASDIADRLPISSVADDATAPVAAALGPPGRPGSSAVVAEAALAAGASPGSSGHPLEALTGSATSTGALASPDRAHDPSLSALVALAFRRAIAFEEAGVGGPIDLLPGIPPSWLGSPLQAHRVPVAGGTVEFAVRWHGDRPALLWDSRLERPMRLTVRMLDPLFSDDRSSGEALLAPTAGLRLEAGPESPAVRAGDALDPEEPSSFS